MKCPQLQRGVRACWVAILSVVSPTLAHVDLCRLPTTSPPFTITATPSGPTVTWSGSEFLVVTCGPNDTLTGTLLSTDGTPLSSFPIVWPSFCSSLGKSAAVSFDGTNFLVVSSTSALVRAQRVTRDGTVLDPFEGLIWKSGSDAATAFDGERHLVVWDAHSATTGTDVIATFVTPDGQVSPEFPVMNAADAQWYPKVACGPANCLVVWKTMSMLYGTRVGPDGTILDPAGFPIGAIEPGTEHDVLFDGERYFVAWSVPAYPGEPASRVMAARIGIDGTVLDATGIAVTASTDRNRAPQVAFDGSRYWIVWWRENAPLPDGPTGVFINAVSRDGHLVYGNPEDGGLQVLGPRRFAVSIAFDGTAVFLAWYDGPAANVQGLFLQPPPDEVPNCWTLAGTNILKVSVNGEVRGHQVRCHLRCRHPALAVLYLYPDGRYFVPAPGLGLGCALPDEAGSTRLGRRDRLFLEPDDIDAIEAGFSACLAANVHLRRYRTWGTVAEDGARLEGQTRGRAGFRTPVGGGVTLPVSIRMKMAFAGSLSTAGLPVEPPPLTRKEARLQECPGELTVKCQVD